MNGGRDERSFSPEARDETVECDLRGEGKTKAKGKGPDRRWGPDGAPFSSAVGLTFYGG